MIIDDPLQDKPLAEVRRLLIGRVVRTKPVTGGRWNRVGIVTHVEMYPDYVERTGFSRSPREIAHHAHEYIVTMKKLLRQSEPAHVYYNRCVWEVAQ